MHIRESVPGRLAVGSDDTIYQDLNVDVNCNLAWDRYVLASQTYIPGMDYGIRARMALPSQTLSDSFWMVAPGQPADRVFPAVGGGRVGFLEAWEHQRDTPGGNRDIHGRLIQHTTYLSLLVRGHS